MPRYHFNVHDGACVLDRDGTELADAASARQEAIRLAAAFLAEGAGTLLSDDEWMMEVVDGRNAVIFRLDLRLSDFSAVEAPTPSARPVVHQAALNATEA